MDATRAKNRVYEEYNPSVEWSRGAEVDSVRITLPGFKREDIRVLVDNHGHLRTRGERQIAGTKWSRFQKDFQLPDNCNVDGIRAKFESETLTITLPKKTPSPPAATPVAPPRLPVPEPPRRPVATPSQRIPPPALPEQPARPAPPPAVPAAPLAPAASQRLPERRPSMPRKPPAAEPPEPELPARLPSVPTPAAVTRPEPSLAAVQRAKEEEEEEKRREMETMGKMEEDRKAAQKKEQEDEAAAMGEMAMARQPRPASASRGLLVNVAVAVVVLLGITAYVWHSLRNAAGGAGDHGHLGAGSYGDEM